MSRWALLAVSVSHPPPPTPLSLHSLPGHPPQVLLHLEPVHVTHPLVLDGSCHSTQELSPSWVSSAEKVGHREKNQQGRDSDPWEAAGVICPCDTVLVGRTSLWPEKGRQLALGEGRALLLILLQLPPLCPPSANFLYGW